MKPKRQPKTNERGMFCQRLDDLLNMEHEIVRLAQAIDWDGLVAAFGPLYAERQGRPGVPIRVMAGIVLLQHTFGISDEKVVETWVQNPYWQYFCGEEFFQHDFPINPSSLSRWRGRIGKEGVERLLALTIQAGKRTGTVTEREMETVIIDTTVQPKAVAHPTDARLYLKALHALLRIAGEEEIKLRQSYTRSAKAAHFLYGRYRKAKQFKRAARERKRLKVYAGRVLRDLERKMSEESFQKHKGTMILAELVLTQKKDTKGKVYSMHAPETECIAKGKAHKPYEFGVKTSLAVTLKSGFVVGAMACPGNPFDGHTLPEQLDQVGRLTGKMPSRSHVDKGYKGHGVAPEDCEVLISGTRKGISKSLRRQMKRRSAVEPGIGHQKSDGKLSRNWLKGSFGDALNPILCGAGHNLRKILARLRRSLYTWIWSRISSLWSRAIAIGQPRIPAQAA